MRFSWKDSGNSLPISSKIRSVRYNNIFDTMSLYIKLVLELYKRLLANEAYRNNLKLE